MVYKLYMKKKIRMLIILLNLYYEVFIVENLQTFKNLFRCYFREKNIQCYFGKKVLF